MACRSVANRWIIAFAALLVLGACSTEPQEPITNPNAGGTVAGPTAGSQEDLRVNGGGDTVFFAFDSSVLSSEAQRTLSDNAAWLQANPAVTVTVEGHADQRGTREYNLALGERRANAIRQYLTSIGVETGRIRTVSYGEERPANPANNESAWAQNRRGVTVVGFSS